MAPQNSKDKLLEAFKKRKLKKLKSLREENKLFDLYLKGKDDFKIGVHKVIISSASDYFSDYFSSPLPVDMKEKNEKCIQLPGEITGDILEKIITFIYTSEFDENIANDEKIIEYANFYQLHELEEICTLILAENLNIHNFLKYWRLGTGKLLHKLQVKCEEFIEARFEQLYKESLLSDLTFKEMISLLRNNRLQCSEENAFDFAWDWCQNYKVDEEISQVMNSIRFSQLNNEFIISKIAYNEDVLKYISKKKIIEILASRLQNKATNPSCLLFTDSNTPRIGSRCKKLFGLTTNAIFQNFDGNVIRTGKELQKGFSFTNFGINYLLVCGGGDGGSSKCEYFEPIKMEWNNFPAMKIERTGHASFYLDNCIYSCGGKDINSIEVFDLSVGQWHIGPRMHERRKHFTLNVNNRALYAFGGGYNNVEIYDPRTPVWRILAENDFPTFGQTRSISYESYIYCFHNGKMYTFDTRTENFTNEIIDLKCEKNCNANFGVCSLNDDYVYISKHKLHNADGLRCSLFAISSPFPSCNYDTSMILAKYDFNGIEHSEKVVYNYNADTNLQKENLETLELVALYY